MNRSKNTIYFDSDDEFLTFCVDPRPVIRKGKHAKYVDFNFTKHYKDELDNGTRFCIKDENSVITKRGAVTFMTESKAVENLDPWYGVEI